MLKKQFKALLIDSFEQEFIEALESRGIAVNYRPGITREAAFSEIKETQILILNSGLHIDREFLNHATELKWIGRAGVGVDHIDMQAVLSSGIQIRVTEGANRDAVGEMTLGLLIALLRNIPKSNQEVKSWQWKREENRGEELTNKTVGIIGFGNTGSAFAKKLRGFEVTVLAYDKYKKGFSKDNVQEVPLEVLFEKADICSFHIPLNSETRHLGDASFFEKFTKPVWILNLSRGEIIDTKALLSAMDKGKVRGAALDVLENERFAQLSTDWKEIYSDLFSRNNILLSPHIGGWTFTSRQNIYNDLLHHMDEAMKTWQQ